MTQPVSHADRSVDVHEKVLCYGSGSIYSYQLDVHFYGQHVNYHHRHLCAIITSNQWYVGVSCGIQHHKKHVQACGLRVPRTGKGSSKSVDTSPLLIATWYEQYPYDRLGNYWYVSLQMYKSRGTVHLAVDAHVAPMSQGWRFVNISRDNFLCSIQGAIASAHPHSLCACFHQRVRAHEIQKQNFDTTTAFCHCAKEYADRYSVAPLGDENTLVIHLRLGDVISDTTSTVDELWSRPMPFFNLSAWSHAAWNYYVRSGYFFRQIPEKIPSNIRTVHLVGNIA